MRLTVTKLGNNTLPLLSEIPSYDVCRLEGFNGIGKSLTIRLLRLCAGTQPYLGEDGLWEGFQAGIGKVRVEAADLAEGRTVLWELDSAELPRDLDDGAETPVDSWFQRILVDGKPATLETVRSLFEVVPIRANEGLLETLADDLVVAAHDVRTFSRGLEASALDDVEGAATDLLRLLAQIDPARVRERLTEQDERRAEAEESVQRLKEAEARLVSIHEATELAAAVERLAREKPQLEADLEGVEAEIATARTRRDTAQEELQKLELALVKSEDAQEELRKATAARKRASTRLRNSAEQLTDALQACGLDDADKIEAHLASVSAELLKLETQRTELDATPVLVELNSDLVARLEIADAAGVGAQIVAELSNRNYSIRELDQGLRTRAERLISKPTAPAATAIDEQIARVQQQLKHAQTVPDLVAAVKTARSQLEKAESRLDDLTKAAGHGDLEALGKLRELRREIDEQLYRLSSRRVVLKHQLEELAAGGDVGAVRHQLTQQLELLQLDENGLPEASTAQSSRVHELAGIHDEQSRVAQQAAAAAARIVEELQEVIAVLKTETRLAWLRDALRDELPLPEDDLETQLKRTEALLEIVGDMDRRISEFRLSLTSVRVALEAESESLRGGEPTAREFRDAAQKWAEARAQEWFAEDSVKRVLIGDVGDVTVDLARRVAVWADSGGVEHTVPLKGFSSGQSVFAHTEAQLMRIGRRGELGLNRLIVIDEFGAFVARNRLDDLRTTLLSWQERHPADQILLILPVSQDYEALAANAVGDRAAELGLVIEGLKSEGYFAESFAA